MKALVFHKPKDVRIDSVEDSKIEGCHCSDHFYTHACAELL